MTLSLKLLFFLLGSIIMMVNVNTARGQKYTGSCNKNAHITYYDYTNAGACSFGDIGGPTLSYTLVTAPNQYLFNGSYSCGVCYQLTGPKGTAIVMVADLCPANGNQVCSTQDQHFDLGGTSTFSKIADVNAGYVQVSAVPVACPLQGNLGVATKDGVNAWWMAIMAYNHVVGVDRMEIQPKTGANWVSMTRQSYNYFVWNGPGQLIPPYNVRVTSVYGEQVTVTLTDTAESKAWPSNSQFQITSAAGSPSYTGCSGTSTPTTPSPSPATSKPSPSPSPATPSPTSAPATSALMTIYDDTFQNGWSDVSWGVVGGSVNYKSTSSPHSGSYCAQFVLSGWGGLQFWSNDMIDWAAKGYTSLSFWIRADAKYSDLEVNIAGTSTTYFMSLTTSWQKVTVSLGPSGLNAPTLIGRDNKIVMQNQRASNSATFFLDDVQLIQETKPSFLLADGEASGADRVVSTSLLVCVLFGLSLFVLF
eukprot:TRINITY_DN1006_c0_g1_i2.p1 TRINITY_DN1006_c0_g1~~TRINITY_DN1006_c0_g1_i2.p1  ORF type:complete len:476 (-),score=140.44 TRINITY_DN1006_c0_g1_i2:214-1641(-)